MPLTGEAKRDYMRKYQKEHREKFRESTKRYDEKHREELREKSKRIYHFKKTMSALPIGLVL